MAKRNVCLYCDSELVDVARSKNINLSQTFNDFLKNLTNTDITKQEDIDKNIEKAQAEEKMWQEKKLKHAENQKQATDNTIYINQVIDSMLRSNPDNYEQFLEGNARILKRQHDISISVAGLRNLLQKRKLEVIK